MPISFFWGEEDFLIEKEINSVKSLVLNNEISELNYKVLDNPPFNDFVYILRSQPMMFGDVLYVIKADKYFLESGKKIKLEENETEELIEALDLIADKVHIILTCQIPRGERKKPDSRKKFYKALQKKGTIKEFQPFKAYEDYKILPVLKTFMKDFNLKADDSVLKEIIALVGPYMRDLYSALDKLSLYVYPKNVITKDILSNLYSSSQNIFKLIDLILEKDYSKALNEISNILQRSHYLEILAFLQFGFSKLLSVKVYSKTMSSYEIARKTSQNEFVVKKTLEKIKNVDLLEIIRLKQNLTNIEFEIKTGEKEPVLALMEGFLK